MMSNRPLASVGYDLDVLDGEAGSLAEVHYAFHHLGDSAWLCVWVDRQGDPQSPYAEGFNLAHGERSVVGALSETLTDWKATDVSAGLQSAIGRAISTPRERWGIHSFATEPAPPPRVAMLCLCFVLSFEDQHIVEELEDLYKRRIERLGRGKVRLWYWAQVCGLLVRKLPVRVIRLALGLKFFDWIRFWS